MLSDVPPALRPHERGSGLWTSNTWRSKGARRPSDNAQCQHCVLQPTAPQPRGHRVSGDWIHRFLSGEPTHPRQRPFLPSSSTVSCSASAGTPTHWQTPLQTLPDLAPPAVRQKRRHVSSRQELHPQQTEGKPNHHTAPVKPPLGLSPHCFLLLGEPALPSQR